MKQNLKELGGSFQNQNQQREMSKAIHERHQSFEQVVQDQAKKNREAERMMARNNIVEPDEGVSLTQDDITGGLDQSQINNINNQEVVQEVNQKSNDDGNHIEINEFGDEVCKYCKTVVKTARPPDLLMIKDDELTTYIFGGRISRKFTIGNVEFEVQSMLQNEVDDVNYRAGQDADNGEVSLEKDYGTRHSLYRLIYSLSSINGQKLLADPPKESSMDEMNRWFNEKFKVLTAKSHQFVLVVSSKQAILENSISFAINDQVRLKN